jgi:hypothetical protein
MLEIGRDRIDTASSFVDYMQDHYGFSKSSTWYCLNKLKVEELIGFANKAEQGKPLSLTKAGLSELGRFENSRNEIITQFSNIFLNGSRSIADSASRLRSYGRGFGAYGHLGE